MRKVVAALLLAAPMVSAFTGFAVSGEACMHVHICTAEGWQTDLGTGVGGRGRRVRESDHAFGHASMRALDFQGANTGPCAANWRVCAPGLGHQLALDGRTPSIHRRQLEGLYSVISSRMQHAFNAGAAEYFFILDFPCVMYEP